MSGSREVCEEMTAPVPDCPACQMGGEVCHNHRQTESTAAR
jgi:hypothetical protein